MFEIKLTPEKVILLSGRFDSLQTDRALQIFGSVNETATVDFTQLEYISSAGMSVLLATQKRLRNKGQQLKLTGMNPHVREIFKYAGFDMIFDINSA